MKKRIKNILIASFVLLVLLVGILLVDYYYPYFREPEMVKINDIFYLRDVGSRVTIIPDNLEIQLTDFLDSRAYCLRNYCLLPGLVVIKLNLKQNGRYIGKIELGGRGKGADTQMVEGKYTIKFLSYDDSRNAVVLKVESK